jgi:hypothetical protein
MAPKLETENFYSPLLPALPYKNSYVEKKHKLFIANKLN